MSELPVGPDDRPADADPMDRPPRRSRGLVVGALAAAALVLAALLVPGGPRVGSVAQAPGSPGLGGAAGSSSGVPLVGPDGLPPEVADPLLRGQAIAAVLDRRGEAIARDDAVEWRAQQITSATVPDFAALAALPVTRWTYTVEGTSSGADPRMVTVTAAVAYRLDVDAEDALLRERITLRHSDAGWRVATESTLGPRAQPWDLGRLTVVRGRASVVIGVDTAWATLVRYAALADAVAGDVSEVWGRDWTRRPVLVVPRTTQMMARGLARSTGSLERIAAVTTAEDGDGGGEVRGADRVWTNTPVMAGLGALGREIVLRHEVLHVAAGAASTSATPLWLEEGLAEYVGYRGSGVSLRTATADVLRAVRDGRAPSRLPSPSAFGGARLAEAYESAHVACDLVADEVGVAGLVRLYRETAEGRGDAEANFSAAVRSVLGSSVESFESRWRARLRALAG